MCGPPVAGFTAGFVFEELVYDVANPGVVYGKPYHEGVVRSTDGGVASGPRSVVIRQPRPACVIQGLLRPRSVKRDPWLIDKHE